MRRDYDSITNELLLSNWVSIINESRDINLSVCDMNHFISTMIVKYIPKRKVKPTTYPVWYSHELIMNIRAKKTSFAL